MSCMPSHLHSSSACRTAHAITYVPTLAPLRPLIPPNQTPATAPTNVNIVETNLQEGMPVSTFRLDHSLHLLSATFSLAMSISATQTKNLFPTLSLAGVEKVLLPHLVQPLPNRPAINAFSPVFHVMAPTHAVRSHSLPL